MDHGNPKSYHSIDQQPPFDQHSVPDDKRKKTEFIPSLIAGIIVLILLLTPTLLPETGTKVPEDIDSYITVDDPPLVKAIMDGWCGFDYRVSIYSNDGTSQSEFYSYHKSGQRIAFISFFDDGSVKVREVFDFSLSVYYHISDSGEGFYEHRSSDVRSLIFYPDVIQVGSGTEIFEGENLPYVDYIYSEDWSRDFHRCFLKNGDVHAIQTEYYYRVETIYITEIYDAPIDDYLYIPD